MRSPLLRKSGFFLALSLLFALLLPAPAQSLSQFKVAPSTVWGHTYAGKTTGTASSTPPKVFNLEAKSKFVVNYKNFPEWAKRDFQSAVDIWAANFASSAPITIDATWGRSGTWGVLGSARPGNYYSGFDGAPDQSLWYPSALANALAGKDLDPQSPDMVIQINSLASWNTRNDGTPLANEYDLPSVFLHEMAHGLGFLSTDSYDPFFGYGTIEQPTPYAAYAQLPDGRRLSDLPSPSIELGKALTSTLLWSGQYGNAANGGEKIILYTPARYEDGSSVSHIDENTYKDLGANSIMTPNLDAGEVFREPGSLLLGMIEDLRRKPPVGVAVGIPLPVRNATALIADGSAIITFDPPANARTAQVTSYSVRNLTTNQVKSVTDSPLTFTGLRNGTSYSFSIVASNTNGTSDAVITAPVIPQTGWKRFIIDQNADGSRVSSINFNGKPLVAYTDSKSGVLRIASWDGKIWRKSTVDGAGGSGARTKSKITSPISLCVNGSGTKQLLHIFYADSDERDLRYATYDGKRFTHEIVDGNGPKVNDYRDPVRVRTGSDVSISNACVASAGGVQVFYRDESQGILLGATKIKGANQWSYELVDGDRKTDGRTMGDVAFHLKALFDGKMTYVVYDSILTINQKKQATSGEVRVASRPTLSGANWSYFNIDTSGGAVPMTGFDVSIAKTLNGIQATWLNAAPTSPTSPTIIRWSPLQSPALQNSASSELFGAPGKFLNSDGSLIAFNCQQRLCVLDSVRAIPTIKLVTSEQNPDGISSAWVTINRVKYLIAGVKGQLSMFRFQ
ncbi:MAG: fibronectin type III domain-containing protein [Candidatus Planktophila sp.]